jgi:hypothetical protein
MRKRRQDASGFNPVLNSQIGDVFKIPHVVRHQSQIVNERRCRDQHIHRRRNLSSIQQTCAQISELLRSCQIDAKNFHSAEHLLNIDQATGGNTFPSRPGH